MDVSDLYRRPLDEFTQARNDLARRLEEENRPDDAERVRALRKPSVTAWAVDQLAHRRPHDVNELVGLSDAITDAETAANVREAMDRRNALVAELTRAALDVLEKAGHAATSSQSSRITRTLMAAGSGPERQALLNGVLERDVEAAGFEASALAMPLQDDESHRSSRAAEKARDLAEAAERAEKEAQRAAREAERARKEADRLAAEAQASRRHAERARERADRAAAEL